MEHNDNDSHVMQDPEYYEKLYGPRGDAPRPERKQFNDQPGSLRRPRKGSPYELTAEQLALIAKNRAEFDEERRLKERHHDRGDTSGGTTDPGLAGYDDDDVYEEPVERLEYGTHIEEVVEIERGDRGNRQHLPPDKEEGTP